MSERDSDYERDHEKFTIYCMVRMYDLSLLTALLTVCRITLKHIDSRILYICPVRCIVYSDPCTARRTVRIYDSSTISFIPLMCSFREVFSSFL